jgi:hypothetical protein
MNLIQGKDKVNDNLEGIQNFDSIDGRSGNDNLWLFPDFSAPGFSSRLKLSIYVE